MSKRDRIDITSITVERLFNMGNYENLKICATASVLAGEDAAAVVRELRAFISANGPRTSKWGTWEWEQEEEERAQTIEYDADASAPEIQVHGDDPDLGPMP